MWNHFPLLKNAYLRCCFYSSLIQFWKCLYHYEAKMNAFYLFFLFLICILLWQFTLWYISMTSKCMHVCNLSDAAPQKTHEIISLLAHFLCSGMTQTTWCFQRGFLCRCSSLLFICSFLNKPKNKKSSKIAVDPLGDSYFEAQADLSSFLTGLCCPPLTQEPPVKHAVQSQAVMPK